MMIAAGEGTVSSTELGGEHYFDFHYSETKFIFRKFALQFWFPNNYEKFGRVGSYETCTCTQVPQQHFTANRNMHMYYCPSSISLRTETCTCTRVPQQHFTANRNLHMYSSALAAFHCKQKQAHVLKCPSSISLQTETCTCTQVP